MKHAPIPFLDLVTPHRELEKELTAVLVSAIHGGAFVGGPMVSDFEKEFAKFCGVMDAVAVNSGTDALRFAFIAAGIRSGDAVITVPNTFIATTEAISQAGATPVFVDIDEQTFNMSPQSLLDFFTTQCDFDDTVGVAVIKKTRAPVKAVVPVHLYGQMANLDAIIHIAQKFGCIVIEDACQAHGAEYLSEKSNGNVRAGVLSAAAAYSFYPGKNLGALGEGGALVTNDPKIARIARMLRDHGSSQKYHHDIEGYNGRLDAIQCGFLSVKLSHLEQWNEERRERAHFYNYLFANVAGVIPPFEPVWSKAVYHLYIIRTYMRDELMKFLSDRGIGTGLHYPVPLHLQKAYQSLPYKKGDFEVSEKAATEILSLPMFPGLAEEQQEFIVESIADFMESRSVAPKAIATAMA